MMEKAGMSNSTSKIQQYVNAVNRFQKFEDYFDSKTKDLVKKWELKPNFTHSDGLITKARYHASFWESDVCFRGG